MILKVFLDYLWIVNKIVLKDNQSTLGQGDKRHYHPQNRFRNNFAIRNLQTGMEVNKFTLQNRMILRVLVLAAWASAELPKVVFFFNIAR